MLRRAIRVRHFGSGDIPRAGGKFGEREHAQEEQYFRKKASAQGGYHDVRVYRRGKRLTSIGRKWKRPQRSVMNKQSMNRPNPNSINERERSIVNL